MYFALLLHLLMNRTIICLLILKKFVKTEADEWIKCKCSGSEVGVLLLYSGFWRYIFLCEMPTFRGNLLPSSSGSLQSWRFRHALWDYTKPQQETRVWKDKMLFLISTENGLEIDTVVIQMLVCKTHKYEKTNRNNSGGSVGKSYSHVYEG